MKPKTVVIGLGLFGREIAVSLAQRGHSVLAVDRSAEFVELVKESVDQAVVMDATDEDALREAKIDEMDTAICAIGAQNVQSGILTTALLHQLQVPRIIARAADDLQARILRQVGATEIANPEKEMGQRIANRIASPGIKEVLTLADGVCVAEVLVPPSFVGETLAGLDVRRRYRVNIVGVRRLRDRSASRTGDGSEPAKPPKERQLSTGSLLDPKRHLILNVEPNEPFEEDDALIVIGNQADVEKMQGLG